MLSTTLFAGLGAWIASLVATTTANPLGALATVSGLWIMFFMGISQIPGDTLNAYTGMLAFASLGTNSKKFMAAQNRQTVRLTGIGIIFVIGTILACLSSAHFYSSFENFIGVLLFFFVPWSAINLVDYYLVKRGRYDVASFFTPEGVYGGFQWWACMCYVITLAVQVPFLDQLFYVGPLVSTLGGADISWIVGFGVASLLYLAGAKRFVGTQPGLAGGRSGGLVRYMRLRGELVAVAFDNLTLSQRVYEHLRDEILADHLLPGTELSEVALSKELAISRGPIREAMGRLAAEGLITMRPRRRAEVRSLTPQELIDAYQVREALEVMAVRLAIPRVTEADLARLEGLIDQMAAHSAAGAVREFFAANVAFHELVCELSGQPEAAGGAPPAGRGDRPVPEPDAGAARQHGRLADRAPRHPGGDPAARRRAGGAADRRPHQGARAAAAGRAGGRRGVRPTASAAPAGSGDSSDSDWLVRILRSSLAVLSG